MGGLERWNKFILKLLLTRKGNSFLGCSSLKVLNESDQHQSERKKEASEPIIVFK
jgi:hypothetical protein